MATDTNSPVPLLRVTDLTVRYGGVLALDSVSLDVPAAGFVGLIGPNGAGKTTFVDALTGFARYSGEVRFDGARLDRQPAYLRARHGLARTFQSGGVFDDLTVEENILIGERRGSGWLPALTSVLTGRSAPNTVRTRDSNRIAVSEWPPAAKKSSSGPTASMPRTWDTRPASTCSSRAS